jgi:hypothetical protein
MDSGPNWSKAKAPVGEPAGHLLDAVQLCVGVRIFCLLPGAGALEGEMVAVQQYPQPFPVDGHRAVGLVAQVVGQLAQAPVGEGQAKLPGSHLGDLDDVRLVGRGDPPRSAAGPPRLQRAQAAIVERGDHIADGVRIGRDQRGDRLVSVARGRREDHHRPTDLDRAVPPPPHDPQQGAALLVRQPTGPYRPGHHRTPSTTKWQVLHLTGNRDRHTPTRPTIARTSGEDGATWEISLPLTRLVHRSHH